MENILTVLVILFSWLAAMEFAQKRDSFLFAFAGICICGCIAFSIGISDIFLLITLFGLAIGSVAKTEEIIKNHP